MLIKFGIGMSMGTEPAQNPPKPLLILVERVGRVGCRAHKMNKIESIQLPTVGCGSWFENPSVPTTDQVYSFNQVSSAILQSVVQSLQLPYFLRPQKHIFTLPDALERL